MKKYFPILLAKAGELQALTRLTQNVKDEIAPVMQVLADSFDKIERFSSNWNFADNELYLDFSLCNPFDSTSITTLITNLLNNNVNVIPVVQANSSQAYINTIQNLFANGRILNVCIRFSNSTGFLNANVQITTLLNTMGMVRNQSSILLDFGLVDSTNNNTISASIIGVVMNIGNRAEYQDIIIASGSFLKDLSALTPAGRVYRIPRYEWNIWNSIRNYHRIGNNIQYGDYGTKFPYYSESKFQGTCSIKYSTRDEYVIYRGELSSNHPNGNGQYITFAQNLFTSPDFSGVQFSWGDERIGYYAGQALNQNAKPGNATNWVAISQNHHITLLNSLL